MENRRKKIASFMRRKSCVLRKAEQLSTLCGVPVCVILFPSDHCDRAETWPPNSADVASIVLDYKKAIATQSNNNNTLDSTLSAHHSPEKKKKNKIGEIAHFPIHQLLAINEQIGSALAKIDDAMARKQTENKFLQFQQWHEDEAGLGAADLIEVTSANDSNTVACDCDYLDWLMSDDDNQYQFGGQSSSSSNALSLVSNDNSVNNDSGNSHLVDSAEELFDCPDDLFADCSDDIFKLLDWGPSNTQLQPPPDSLFDQSMQIQMLPPLDALDYCHPHMMPMYDDVQNCTLNGVGETGSFIQPPTTTLSENDMFDSCFGGW